MPSSAAPACEPAAPPRSSDRRAVRTRNALRDAAFLADPGALGEAGWQVQSLVLLMRSPLVDLLEASGETPEAAREALPEL